MRILLLSLLLISCGKIIAPAKTPQVEMLEELRDIYNVNLSKLKGWPSRTDCDATLWAGIAKAGGVKLDLTESRDKTGKWFRRPSRDCFDRGESRSDFSNDMLVGMLLAASRSDISDYLDWLKEHDYNMGRGDIGATIVKPNVLGVMGRVLGKNLAPRLPYAKNDKDYVRHIQTLLIYIDGRSTGYIKKSELDLLRRYDDDKDYLIQAVIAKYDGSYDKPINLLLKQPKPPSYVRGDQPERYRLAHWLFATSIIIGE